MKCHRQCVCLLLQVISFVANCFAENLIFNINFKKPIAVTDQAFLSFTLDPTTLQHNDLIQNIERSTNLARGLAPAYIRFGGPQSNFYNFGQVNSYEIDMDPNDIYFGTQWILIYQWAKNAGLDMIVCITPHYIDNESKTDSKDLRNIAELLSFSDRMGYNISWQLGYECQMRCDLSGGKLGQYVVNLREILKTFPRYSNSLITGPDILAYRTAQQQKYFQDYLHSANTALSAITWHPDLDSISRNNDNISIHYDNIIAEKNELYKIISRMAKKTPLWIAESKSEENRHQYLGALIWTKKLGDVAKLGIQVVMRQLSKLSQATPDYWVSLLYKTLVGREVLEMKLQSENENHVYFYSQCTKSSTLYTKGAITIFGINLTPRKVIVSLKDFKIKILHKYILSPDFETCNKIFSENVLLNNKSLHLINNKELPDINPEIIIDSNGLELELPSFNIGFWVIPNAKVKACICSEEETIEKNYMVKKLSKRYESNIQQNQEEKEENINQSNNGKIHRKQNKEKQKNVEDIENESQLKVWDSKLLATIKRILQKRLQKKNENEPSNMQRSFKIDLEDEQGHSFEKTEEQNLERRDLKKNLKDHFKQKIRRKSDDQKELISFDNSKKDFNDNENKYNILQRNPVKKFFKSNAFENGHHINYQHVTQEPKRMKRDLNKKLIELDLRRNRSASRKRLKIDDLRNYINERKTKQKDYMKREGLLVPFNPRITDSDENNFYGFFRRDPVKGFPESDIFVTTGDSLEQNRKDYDYIEDEDDDNDNSEEKNTQHNQKSILDHTKDNTWIEEDKDDHCDYIPNEFFENIKLSNTKIKENSKNYDDLWEAEFPLEEHNNNENNYQTSNNDKVKLKDEKEFVMNIDNRDDINAKTTQHFRPSVYAEHPIHDRIRHNKRKKRSNWEELRKIFSKEMIKKDEENVRDYHRRVIRDSDSSKKLYYHRVKHNISVTTAQFRDTSSENKNVNTDFAQFKENVQTPMTTEEYEEIMAGKILPRTNIELVSEENYTTTESVITESNTLDHKLSDTTQSIVTSISEMDNISEQYHDMKKSTTNLLPMNSTSEISVNNNNSVQNITKETFFRTQVSDIQSKNKTKTHDSLQVIFKIPPKNKSNLEEINVSTQETTYQKALDLINEKEKADSSIYSTITDDQKNEEGRNNDYKTGFKSTNFLKETSKGIVEQVTTETILSKRAVNATIDNSKSNESKINTKLLLRNIEDNQNNESKARMGKDDNMRRLKIILKNLPRTSLERLVRYEEYLLRRAEQIDKQKEKLHTRREKFLHQYQDKLTKIVDEQKRNLKRREVWENLHGTDDFRRLIDQGAFIGVLLNDDVSYEDNDDLIPIELLPKEYNNIIDQIYLLSKAKKIRYPEHNKYYQFLQNLIENDEELIEMSKSLERKYNQYYVYIPKIIEANREAEASRFLNREDNQDCQYSSKTIEDERESTETTSRSFDRKVFIIDPATYYGGEPILQSHENYLKLPQYHSKIKSHVQDPTSRWILRNFRQVLSRLKSNEEQHETSESQEYIKILPIKNYYNKENTNILRLLNTQMQYDLQKELAVLAQVWLSSLARRDVNRIVSNKEGDELNNMHKNLEADNLDFIFAINKKRDGDFETDKSMEYKEFVSSSNRKKDIIKSIEDAEEVLKTKKSENIELTKSEEINKFSNDEAGDTLNIKKFNNNKTDEHVEKIIDDNLKERELGKENMRTRRGRESEEFVYEDLSNLQTENTENNPNKESLCENEQDVSMDDSEAELGKDEPYEITNDEIDKYLKIQNQIRANERGIFVLLPLRNMKNMQRKQIKNEINEDIDKIKHEVTRHIQSNKSILAKDLDNKRTKRNLNNNIDREEEKYIIETNNIKANYLQSQTNGKNRNDLLEDFIKARKKNNLHDNEASSLKNEKKNEIMSLNNISNSKKLLQKAIPKQKNMEYVQEFVDNSGENFNDTLAPDEDKYYRNRTSETGNTSYTAIMKDFFAFLSKISQIFMYKF